MVVLPGGRTTIFSLQLLEAQATEQLRAAPYEAFAKKAPLAMEILEKGSDDATAILELPVKYRKRLRTTNSLERLNEEIRRRERVIRIFPNRDSANRLIGALLLEIDNKWAGGRRYLDMAEYHEHRSCRPKPSSNIFYL
jgi:putative transposase